ncbi:MAG: hypothetical protein NTV35_06200 [Chloroflexi bacterium]|nr:hypothetical protein [Chloroflexota bacterium]
MTSTPRGLHESLITDRLASQLARDRASHHLSITDEALSGADAPERLASHVEAVIRRAILDLGVEDRAAVGTREMVRNHQDPSLETRGNGRVAASPPSTKHHLRFSW